MGFHPCVNPMPPPAPSALGRRERQIMDIVYRLGRASAGEVQAELPDPPRHAAVRGLARAAGGGRAWLGARHAPPPHPPGNAPVRGMRRLLEEKRYLRHEQDGPRYVYIPTDEP